MRRALCSVLLLSACAVSSGRNVPIAPGGSVADFDRGASAAGSPETGTPAGARDTIGSFDRETTAPMALAPTVIPPAVPRVGGPAEVRRLQETLAARGYYHGPISGQEDAALTSALRRYQFDTGLPLVVILGEGASAPDGGAAPFMGVDGGADAAADASVERAPDAGSARRGPEPVSAR